MKRTFKIIIILLVLVILCRVYATDNITEMLSEELDLGSLLNSLQSYAKDNLDVGEISNDILSGNGIDYGAIGNKIFGKFASEITSGVKTMISIVIIIVLMAIVKSVELEKDSSVSNVANLVGYLVIVVMLLKAYTGVIKSFLDTVKMLTSIMEIVAPFMLSMLIATGEVTTSGIIGSTILFVSSLIGVIANYVIVPLLTISLVFKLITNMSDAIKLNKISSLCSSSAMWVLSVVCTVFLGVVGLESSVTTSIDAVTIKTAQTAVSNIIPVVGKFVSDSLEVFMGASQIIGKTAGLLGILVILAISITPVIKLVVYDLIYFVLSAIAEALGTDKKISGLISDMASTYKAITGIMIGIVVIFVIAIALVMKTMGNLTV